MLRHKSCWIDSYTSQRPIRREDSALLGPHTVISGRALGQLLIGGLLVAILGGCAIHYYDKETQAEHIWGFGHMKLKASVPQEGTRAIVKQTELLGLGIGVGSEHYY